MAFLRQGQCQFIWDHKRKDREYGCRWRWVGSSGGRGLWKFSLTTSISLTRNKKQDHQLRVRKWEVFMV